MSKFWSKKKTPKLNKTRLESWFDYCAILPGNKLVAVGWVWNPDADLDAINFSVADEKIDVSEFRIIRGTRKDVCEHFGEENSDNQWGMVIVAELSETPEYSEEKPLELELSSSGKKIKAPLPAHSSEQLTPFRQHIQVLKVCEQVEAIKGLVKGFGAVAIQRSQEFFKPVEQLQSFVKLEVEKAIKIPGKGLFILWLVDGLR